MSGRRGCWGRLAVPEVPLPPATKQPHRAAYACLAGGLGLIGASFVFSHQADDSYANYLSASEPDEIQHWYDEAGAHGQGVERLAHRR
jgi:hypothetical protein